MAQQPASVWQLTKPPRQWQLDAVDCWSEAHRGVVSVVTGAGKTTFALMCMLALQRVEPDVTFLIVVPTLALLDQWQLALLEDLGAEPSDIAVFSGSAKRTKPRRINLLVLNTARRWVGLLSQDLAKTCLIVDECHRAGSSVNQKALRGSHIGTLGLSATPIREHDEGFEQWIAPTLGPVIFTYGYDAALKDRIITPYDLVNVRVAMLPAEERDYQHLTRRIAKLIRGKEVEEGDARVERLLQRRAAVSASAAMRIPVAVKIVEQHPRERCIIFHERIDAAEQIAAMLQDRGVRVALYHTRIGEVMRLDNLRLFRRGVFDCIVTCRALDEGVNVPETRIAIIASATSSVRQRIQRFGRVLRPAPGKTSSVIYTIYATDLEEQRLLREPKGLRGSAQIVWMSGGIGADASNPRQ